VQLREKLGEKPVITHRIVAIGSDLGVLVTLDFNKNKFLCAFSCVHNGWKLSAGDVFLVRPSVILIGAL
jgi:hypothetical protein